MANKDQRQLPAAALLDPVYVFSALSLLGFVGQWIVMIINGALVAMLLAAWKGSAPNGTPVKPAWTGIWPIDFALGVLAVFFGGLLDVDAADLFSHPPYLLLVDLILSLAVCGMMTLVEDRRNRRAGPLRYPALWAIMWNYFGAASVVPVFSRLYVQHRPANSPSLPRDQAQALPFTALWSVLLSLPLLAPAVLGAEPFRIQDGVVVWFLAPLAVGPFQDLVSALISRCSSFYRGFASPVTVAYSIVGLVSAAVHLGVLARIFQSPGLSWSRIYLPNPTAVQSGPTLINEAALLFIQFGHLAVSLSVFALGIYTLGFVAKPPAESSRGKRFVFMLVIIEAIAGPGAALAWLLSSRERETSTADSRSKDS
ncbi:hypothetical protein F5Y05DRAFT_255595 [Hypoxylon sp. FL0543]|nr:hypothetical protein F5Y05DRAFT_255595 [Hypoxylon sp. FL0543]